MNCSQCKSFIPLESDEDGFCGKQDKFLPPSSEACTDYIAKQIQPARDTRKILPE
jgi:hypothetical protein